MQRRFTRQDAIEVHKGLGELIRSGKLIGLGRAYRRPGMRQLDPFESLLGIK